MDDGEHSLERLPGLLTGGWCQALRGERRRFPDRLQDADFILRTNAAIIEIREILKLRGLLPVDLGGLEIKLEFFFTGTQGIEASFRWWRGDQFARFARLLLGGAANFTRPRR